MKKMKSEMPKMPKKMHKSTVKSAAQKALGGKYK